MKIEMWADIVCSWCGIANKRVNEAVAQFAPIGEIELVHRSFRLLPDLPDGTGFEFTEYMSKQRGVPRAQVEQLAARVEGIAQADGIEAYHVMGNTIGNTTAAHEFLAWATEQGMHREAWDLLFHANFAERAEIWTTDELAAFAPRLGLDAEGARAALSAQRYRGQVEEDHAEALALGSQGVPFLVIDRKYGMSGAQSVEAIVNALQTAWEERSAA
ncbi:DsbA family oxidoreductase [Agromyces atrinae]|uniref:DsbA family oxidoreductase n=1 Tax=Agromyces atrinae TaxID=592376 RepID=A0A4V1R2T0_9MICO|nr:DsbA family oxidoreductase [Agromyces atrinae]NYD67561.1 putative DsbA family dithiol-disulfide isomerase [Agromyces atrinae]RXZ88226.1 DsbA family oxidoreductase [Agromyces atrinae]